jgi:hypothetical protein
VLRFDAPECALLVEARLDYLGAELNPLAQIEFVGDALEIAPELVALAKSCDQS